MLCLNIGTDPPDVVRPFPCARVECWKNTVGMYRTKAAASTADAIERGEPFPNRRHVERNQQAIIARTRQRAWGQDIVFLPPTVARLQLPSPVLRRGQQATRAMLNAKEGAERTRAASPS